MSTTHQPTFALQRADARGSFDHGWLKTHHSFSFAEYYDPANLHWGALRVFNDDEIAPSSGFPMHPHRDMEIITYVLSGELEHQDSMGNRGVVRSGGVQFMSAGTGVRHSEVNPSPDTWLHLVQMWVVPGQLGMPPSYGQMDFTTEERTNRWLRIASGDADVQAPIRITQNATFSVTRLDGTQDAFLLYDFAPHRYGYLFVAEGTIDANGETLRRGDAVRLYDVHKLALKGRGEAVLWDVPPIE